MKKLFLFIFAIAILGCNQVSKNSNNKESERLKEINMKSCISALVTSQMADSATASEFCECSINKMFEMYSTEEIMKWNELSREEKIKREEKINQDCNHILKAAIPNDEPETE
ncbi:MAG: hypothetical protein K8R53_09990 [Bacteroidales bacterium]|nr:hypothetical protein [Bacteroidales bacterium]